MKNKIGDLLVEKGDVAELRRPTQFTQLIGMLSRSFAKALVEKTNFRLFSTKPNVTYQEAQAAVTANPGWRLPTVKDLVTLRSTVKL
jgi:hypothetical protein